MSSDICSITSQILTLQNTVDDVIETVSKMATDSTSNEVVTSSDGISTEEKLPNDDVKHADDVIDDVEADDLLEDFLNEDEFEVKVECKYNNNGEKIVLIQI